MEGPEEFKIHGLWAFYYVKKHPIQVYDECTDRGVTFQPKAEPYYIVVGTAHLIRGRSLMSERFLGRTSFMEMSIEEFHGKFFSFSHHHSVYAIRDECVDEMKNLLLQGIEDTQYKDLELSMDRNAWLTHIAELIDGKLVNTPMDYQKSGWSPKPKHPSHEKLLQQDRLSTEGKVPHQQPVAPAIRRVSSTGSFIGVRLERSSNSSKGLLSPPPVKEEQ